MSVLMKTVELIRGMKTRVLRQLMKSVPEVVLHKVPDENLGRYRSTGLSTSIKMVKTEESVCSFKDDLSDWEEKNKRAIINGRIVRTETNSWLRQTGRRLRTVPWTSTRRRCTETIVSFCVTSLKHTNLELWIYVIGEIENHLRNGTMPSNVSKQSLILNHKIDETHT